MKIQEAPSSINKVLKFPNSVTSYLRPEDSQHDKLYGLKGGLLKDTQYAWLNWGPNFEVIRTSNCAKVAAWTFGAVLRDHKTNVTCVAELPSCDGSARVLQFVVGLECDVGGMICVFDIRGSKVLRAVQVPSKVMSMNVVDYGTVCYPLPQILSSMNGVLAVGLAGGELFLVDLCRHNYDEESGVPSSELRDEQHPCRLLPVSANETDPDTLECKRVHAARTGDHLCVVLNEKYIYDKTFIVPIPNGSLTEISRRRVSVTALLYVPRLTSVVVGFSFGSFQIWNLMTLSLEYHSPVMEDLLPVAAFGFQEPCDDPQYFCYLWVITSNGSSQKQRLPCASLYSLFYQNKDWVDGYGYLYQDFVRCEHKFEFDLDADNIGAVTVGGRSIACHTINKLSRRDNPRVDLEESMHENDLTLSLFVWENWGAAGNTGCKQMALFDLNQWYKEQMPQRIVKGQGSMFMTLFSLDNATPLLDVRVDPTSLSMFTAVQRLEEHYYPSALAFESVSLLGEKVVKMNHPGVQRHTLSQLEQTGPSALLHPSKFFHHCIAVGLKPMYTEVTSNINCSLEEQRNFLLSVALEYQLVGLLSRCAAEWMDGSQSVAGCTLSTLLEWGWKRASVLKTHADSLCIPLYDCSGTKLDSKNYQLLDYCGNQLHHLATLFQVCRNPSLRVAGLGDLQQQARVLELVAMYIEVVQWFVNVGLLPEFPCNDISLAASQHRVPYPATALAKIYQNRRSELERLSKSAADKTDILFIDGLVKRECNDRLSALWERDGGTGLYPPPSIQSLLRTYLLDGIPMHVKHCIVIYVFLDLTGLLDGPQYASTINQFIKFPSAFRLTPSFIKITQALWLLDHQDFTEAIDMLLDPLVSMDDLKPWQHQCIIRAFLYQGQHQMALKYIKVQQPPLKHIEDIRLNLTVLLVNGQIHEAFQYQRQHCNEQNSKDLLQHFFSACQQMNELSVVLQLALSPAEEDAFTQFLQSCHNPRADDMRVLYYLERSRIAEAMEVNDSIRSSEGRIESNSLKRGRSEDKPSCVRDTIVQAYANTLPSVTRKLAQYCAQEKSKCFAWKQVSRPTPMSVTIHRGQSQPVQYKSSLIQATLEKARETWIPCTPAKRDRTSMEMTPFLCTPRAGSEIVGYAREVTPVIFPTLKHTSPRSDDEALGGSPVKRLRYSASLGSGTPSQRTRLDRYSSTDALSLLQTPHVRRRTPSTTQQQRRSETPSASVFTPQSILKVRRLVRRSVSPGASIPSFTPTSTTPDLMDDDERMQVSDEEIGTSRQIRFSLPPQARNDSMTSITPEITPSVTPEVTPSVTPDIIRSKQPVTEAVGVVTRSATRKSILGVTPRKPIQRSGRTSSVQFGNADKSINKTRVGVVEMDFTLANANKPEDGSECTSADSEPFYSLDNTEEETFVSKTTSKSVEETEDDKIVTKESVTVETTIKRSHVCVESAGDPLASSEEEMEEVAAKPEQVVSHEDVENNRVERKYIATYGEVQNEEPSYDKSMFEDEDECEEKEEQKEVQKEEKKEIKRRGVLVDTTLYDESTFDDEEQAEEDEEMKDKEEVQNEENKEMKRRSLLVDSTLYNKSVFEDEEQAEEGDEKEKQEEGQNEEKKEKRRRGLLVDTTLYDESEDDEQAEEDEEVASSLEVEYESDVNEDVAEISIQDQNSDEEEKELATLQPVAVISEEQENFDETVNKLLDYMDSSEEELHRPVSSETKEEDEDDDECSEEEDEEDEMEESCFNCRTKSSSVWRYLRGNAMCNECALYLKRHGTNRPISDIQQRQKSDDEGSVVLLDSSSEEEEKPEHKPASRSMRDYDESEEEEDTEEENEEEEEEETSASEEEDMRIKADTPSDDETEVIAVSSTTDSVTSSPRKKQKTEERENSVEIEIPSSDKVEEAESGTESSDRLEEEEDVSQTANVSNELEIAPETADIQERNDDTDHDVAVESEVNKEASELNEDVEVKGMIVVEDGEVHEAVDMEKDMTIQENPEEDKDMSKTSKEDMDFESCINMHEISKTEQEADAMEVDRGDEMDFEAEISASHITKHEQDNEGSMKSYRRMSRDSCASPEENAVNVRGSSAPADDGESSKSVRASRLEDIEEECNRTGTTRAEGSSRVRAGSVPPGSICGKRRERSKRSGSAPPEEIVVHSRESSSRSKSVMKTPQTSSKRSESEGFDADVTTEILNSKSRKTSRAGSIQPEGTLAEDSKQKEAGKSSSRDCLVHSVDVPTPDAVYYTSEGRTTRKGSSRAGSVQPEDTVTENSDSEGRKDERSASIQPEDGAVVDSSKRTTRKGSSRAGSVQPEDTVAENSDSEGRKDGRSASIQPEDGAVVDLSKRTTRKGSSRAGSVQPEDTVTENSDSEGRKDEISASIQPEDGAVVDSSKRTTRKGSSRAGSVQPEDTVAENSDSEGRKDGRSASIQPEDGAVVDSSKRTTRKGSSRAGSVQPEDTVAENSDSEGRKDGRSASIQLEDGAVVNSSKRITRKGSSRAGSVQPEDTVTENSDSEGRKDERSASIQPEDGAVVDSSKRTTRKGSSRAGSVQPEDAVAENSDSEGRKEGRSASIQLEDGAVVDSSKRTTRKGSSRAGSVQPEDTVTENSDSEGRKDEISASIQPEDGAVVDSSKRTTRKGSNRAGSVQPEDTVAENSDSEGRKDGRSASIQPEDGAVVDSSKRTTRKGSSRAGSVQPEDSLSKHSKGRKTSSRAGSIEPEEIFVEDTDSSVRKTRRSLSRVGSVEPEEVPSEDSARKTRRSLSRVGSVEPEEVPREGSTRKTRRRSGSVQPEAPRSSSVDTEGHEASFESEEEREVRSQSVTSDASTVKIRTTRRGRSSDVTLDVLVEEPEESSENTLPVFSGRRTRSAAGSVHELELPSPSKKRSPKRTPSEAGSISSVRTLRSGKVISESDDDAQSRVGTRRARADSTSHSETLSSEQVMEEYATERRLTRHQRSMLQRSLELAKTSSQPRRHSGRLPAVPETSDDEDAVDTRLGSSSPATDNSPPKTPKRTRSSLSRLNDVPDSPASVKSGASSVYTGSVMSTQSEDVTLRPRRGRLTPALKKAASEHGYPLRGGRGQSPSDRVQKLQEDFGSEFTFHFSPPTVVTGAGDDASSASVPAFVFSPPQKQQPSPKLHRTHVSSPLTRAHTMALRGLHTIKEESSTSASSSSSLPVASERDTVPLSVKKSKKARLTPKTRSRQISIMAERERASRPSASSDSQRVYRVYKQRKVFRLSRSKSSQQ